MPAGVQRFLKNSKKNYDVKERYIKGTTTHSQKNTGKKNNEREKNCNNVAIHYTNI